MTIYKRLIYNSYKINTNYCNFYLKHRVFCNKVSDTYLFR
jgi:hypothetical protein